MKKLRVNLVGFLASKIGANSIEITFDDCIEVLQAVQRGLEMRGIDSSVLEKVIVLKKGIGVKEGEVVCEDEEVVAMVPVSGG